MQNELGPFFGIFLHAVGGLAAASFYIPYTKVQRWAWEVFWIVGGFFSWIVAPWAFALVTVPSTVAILQETPPEALFYTFLFGVLWGIGGLTFGMTMRYLGIALGYSLVLGLTAVIGTLGPPIVAGQFGAIICSLSCQVLLVGVSVCLIGVALNGRAGFRKESELPAGIQDTSTGTFSVRKGIVIALFCGIMSSAMAAAFVAGKPIAEVAIAYGVPTYWQNAPVLIVVLLGGFATNVVWCTGLMIKNRSWADVLGKVTPNGESQPDSSTRRQIINVLFCSLAGLLWYLQMFLYGIGTTFMGAYEFSSWSLHMASIIIFSTLWGIALKEWTGVSRKTITMVAAGLFALVLSITLIGWGNALSVGSS